MSSFTPPDHVVIDDETLQAIAKLHSPGDATIERLPETEIINVIHRLGETAIPRVPRNHPDVIAHAYREAVAVPSRSWAERPLRLPLEVLRFFLDPPDERWRAVSPIERPTATMSPDPTRSGGVALV